MSNLSDEARKAATKYERADRPITAGLFRGLADALDAAEAREAGLRGELEDLLDCYKHFEGEYGYSYHTARSARAALNPPAAKEA